MAVQAKWSDGSVTDVTGEVSYRTEPLTTDVTSVEISYTSGENRGHSTFLRFYRVKG